MTFSMLLRQPKFLFTLILASGLSMMGLQFNVLGGFLLAYNLREVYGATGRVALWVGLLWTAVHLAMVPFLGKGAVLAQILAHQAVWAAALGLAAGYLSMPRVKTYFAWVAVAGLTMGLCEGLTQLWGQQIYHFSYFGALLDEVQRVSNQFMAASKATPEAIKSTADMLQPMLRYVFTLQLCFAMVLFYLFSVAYLRLFHSDRAPESSRLRYMELPRWIMFVMLGAWAVLLITRGKANLSGFTDGAIHLIILCVFVYLVQGMAVLAHFFTRPGRKPWVGLLLLAVLVMAGFKLPLIYGVLFVLILGFGLFDPWLKYRRPDSPQ